MQLLNEIKVDSIATITGVTIIYKQITLLFAQEGEFTKL